MGIFVCGDLLGLFALIFWLRRQSAAAFQVAGPYRHVRNPITIAGGLVIVGTALVFGSLLLGIYAIGWILIADVVVRPLLERGLENRFGAAFGRYRQRVRCWRPRWRGYDPAREADETPLPMERTTAPGRYVLFYDGHCRLCEAGSQRMLALAQPGKIERIDFQQPGVLDAYPGVSYEACMEQMILVTPTGRVYGGFEAAVQAVATRTLGKVALLYYVPGIKLILDVLYAAVAANRYRIMGKTIAAGGCDSGACAVHFKKR
jgi:predicted DCC family thiol-disulfide oxidoreductase YuxK